ncbi:hypothetical protein [Geosporobacter ferrireducens]|uniref:DUF3006 domain-containing protein n=1 Tax=Geosporobacter ferrireducens TaxID=1424294 RepID=A0A1D8GMR8_9FIRM|nr:hypothetical protein [Geosporobacter ferrireducens]AOT72177.1 hypothetical protein Gferi_23115 [Geosporobacter ferrireducens]MTI56066.1 hypothetical protein [Geosporobacter ferrireducens]
MLAVLQQMEDNTAIILTDRNYRVVVPAEMIPQGAKVGDRIYLELRTEIDNQAVEERMDALENEYLHTFF